MSLAEARRILEICAVCNYCNGFCEAFRAVEQRAGKPARRSELAMKRPLFSDGDVLYIAHLCHNCGNCLQACQYASPHPFGVNVPRTLAEVRRRSWRDRPWLALLLIVAIPLLTLALIPWNTLFQRHAGPGAFYAVLPWETLVAVAGAPFVLSVAILAARMAKFWRESGGVATWKAASAAIGDAVLLRNFESGGGLAWKAAPAAFGDVLLLRNLEGGGLACQQGPARRFFHGALFLGFMLCFAATLVTTAYHHALGWPAPYPFFSLPVLLGAIGGVGMIAGSAGLAWLKATADPELDAGPKRYSFLALLFAVAFTGLALLALRDTAAMGLLLATHLGFVAGLFATFPYGKFAHAPYRTTALLRAAMERRRKS